MSWSYVTIWIVCIATGLNVAIMLRMGAKLNAPWLLLQGGIFAFTLGGSFYSQTLAASVGGGLWLLFVLVPSLLIRTLFRFSAKRQYRLAIATNTVLSWLHPSQMFKKQDRFLRILQQMSLGQESQALEQLQEIAQTEGPFQQIAKYFMYYLQADWQGLLDHLHAESEAQEGMLNSTQSFWLLRALAETGRLTQLIQTYQEAEQKGVFQGETMFETWGILTAFCGQLELTQMLLDGPLSRWSRDSQQLLLATALWTRGEEEKARAILQDLSQSSEPMIRKRALARLESPPASPKDLPPAQREFLQTLSQNIQRDLRYAGQQALSRWPLLTWLYAAVLIGIFVVAEWRGGSTNPYVLVSMGAMMPAAVLKGHYWQLFMFSLLHFGALHLCMNLLALLMFGPFVERTLGAIRFVILLLLASVGGGILIVAAAHYTQNIQMLGAMYVGASGAIFGLIGVMLGVMLKGWWKEKALLAKKRVIWLLLIIALQTAFDLMTPQISVGAHWSGLILGVLFALLAWKPAQNQKFEHKTNDLSPSSETSV